MHARAKESPEIGILQAGDACEFEFKEVALAGVHVDAVDAFGVVEGVFEGVAASGGEDEHFIVRLDLEDF